MEVASAGYCKGVAEASANFPVVGISVDTSVSGLFVVITGDGLLGLLCTFSGAEVGFDDRNVGGAAGDIDKAREGASEGASEGMSDGMTEGAHEREREGATEGVGDGSSEGATMEGRMIGTTILGLAVVGC